MKNLLLVVVLIICTNCIYSQVGFGTNIPNATSALDISSISKGTLLPRLTTAERLAIVSPSNSLTVFDTTLNLYFYFNLSNLAWTPVNACSIKTLSAGGTYDLQENDNGRILDVTSSSTTIIRVKNTLPIGFQVSITQAGTGGISFVGSLPMTLFNRYEGTKSAGRWAKIGIEVKSSTISILSGDVN